MKYVHPSRDDIYRSTLLLPSIIPGPFETLCALDTCDRDMIDKREEQRYFLPSAGRDRDSGLAVIAFVMQRNFAAMTANFPRGFGAEA